MTVNFNAQPRFQTRQNPEAYAKTYAQQNGITIEEAREELRAKYGDPRQDLSKVSVFASQNIENSYYDFNSSNLDITDFDLGEYTFGNNVNNIQMLDENGHFKGLFQKLLDFLKGANPSEAQTNSNDPDAMAKEYAKEHNISIEEAKAELKEKYGDPQKK